MGLVDKLKNIFTEEVEEDDIKVEQIKKEVRSVPIESPREHTPSREDFQRVSEEPYVPEVEEPKKEEEKAKSPVFFTDRDFEDLVTPRRSREPVKPEKVEEPKREEVPKPYGGSYNSNTIIQKEKQIFKPTPIISPVYGILDKNYHKEDIVDRNEVAHQQAADGLSVDSIRNKAYGTLEDELEDTIDKEPVKKTVTKRPIKREEEEDLFDELEERTPKTPAKPKEDVSEKIKEQEKNIRELEEITMDLTKELDNLLLQKEKDKKTVAPKRIEKKEEEEESIPESDLFNLIDSMYDEGEDE